jgi:hypothetical protein
MNAVLLEKGNKIGRSVSGESRFGEVRIRRNEIVRSAIYVGEIAASSTGDENFLPGAFRTFKHSNAAAALARLNRAY